MDLSYPPAGSPLPPPPPAGMHIGGLAGTWNVVKQGSTASLTVTAHDTSHAVLAGVTVSVSWSGAASGSGTCTTAANGTCKVTTQKFRRGSSVTFTVTNLAKADYVYQPGNNDVSNVLTVTKP